MLQPDDILLRDVRPRRLRHATIVRRDTAARQLSSAKILLK
jgi:hypothetical protein